MSMSSKAFCPLINDDCKRTCAFRDKDNGINCGMNTFFSDIHKITNAVDNHDISLAVKAVGYDIAKSITTTREVIRTKK